MDLVRAFAQGETDASPLCGHLDELVDWAESVEEANEIEGVDEDRFLMYAFAYGLVGICLPLGKNPDTIELARAEAKEWIPFLEAGQAAWEDFVTSGGVPFPEVPD